MRHPNTYTSYMPTFDPSPSDYMREYIHAAYWADNTSPYINYLWGLYKWLKYGEAF